MIKQKKLSIRLIHLVRIYAAYFTSAQNNNWKHSSFEHIRTTVTAWNLKDLKDICLSID